MRSPYTKQFNKKKHNIKIILISLSVIVIIAAFIVFNKSNESYNQQKILEVNVEDSKYDKEVKTESENKNDENYITENDDESDKWEKQINETIEKINKRAMENRRKREKTNEDKTPSNEIKTILDKGDNKQNKTAKAKTTKIKVDLFRKCRYSFTTKYNMQGGVDLLVMDTYTGELRIKRNFHQDESIKLYTNDFSSSGERRFFELVSYQLEGGHDIFILDSFTGEIKGIKKFTEGKSLKLFKGFENKGYIRYTSNIWYRDRAIDFYVMDDCTSEIKMKIGLIKGSSVSLFQNEINKKFTFPRYSFWLEAYPERIDCYSIDTFTSTIRVKRNITRGKNIKMFKKNDSNKSKPRYSAWYELIDGSKVLFVFDAYKCKLKKTKELINDSEIRLFNNDSDVDAWMRYEVFINYVNNNIEINGFDSVTGKLIVKSISDFEETTLFEENKKKDPKDSRYSISIQRGIYDNRLEIYIMDRHTSEIRRYIRKDNKKEIKLF